MNTRVFVLLFLIGVALADVVIEPQNAVLRTGQSLQMTCKSNQEIGQCLWEVNGELYIPSEDIKYKPYGDPLQGECGIQTVLTEKDNGVWKCQIFPRTGGSASKASTNVTIVSIPHIELSPAENPITVAANRESEFKCVLHNARPVPEIKWIIGQREVTAIETSAPIVSRSVDDLYTVTSTLRYTLQAEDHNQMLKCLAVGSWFSPEDQQEAAAQLNVQFPPQPREEITMYGFVEGQPGDLSVNFTANPRPYRVYWAIDENTQIPVDLNGQSQQEGDQIAQLIEGGDNSYEARLRIASLSEADAAKEYRLVVNSELDGLDHTQEYIVRISLTQPPLVEEESGLSGGGIAAIIIVFLLVLVIAAVVLFAHHSGRWCFAGTKAVGVSTKNSDEESATKVIEPAEKTEPSKRSLSNRLSSLYETIISKTAAKKSDRNAGVSNCAADPEIAKDGAVVYAELDIRTPGETENVRGQGESTEYAEIVALSADKKSQEAAQKETA